MTISIELDAATLDNLRREADACGVPIEEHAMQKLRAPAVSPGGIPVSDEVARAAMEASFLKNDELYRRLAK